LLLQKFLGLPSQFGPFNGFQHHPTQRVISKRSENDALSDASAGTASDANKNLQGLGFY